MATSISNKYVGYDLDIGGTEFNFDSLLGMIRYWRRHYTKISDQRIRCLKCPKDASLTNVTSKIYKKLEVSSQDGPNPWPLD